MLAKCSEEQNNFPSVFEGLGCLRSTLLVSQLGFQVIFLKFICDFTKCFSNCECFGYYDHSYISKSKRDAQFLQILEPLRQLFTGPSDLLVCFMTLNRLRTMQNISTVHVEIQQRMFMFSVGFSYFISIIINLPGFWGYQVVNCHQHINKTLSLLNNGECYDYFVPNLKDEKYFWQTYLTVYVLVLKIVPALSIVILNILVIVKLKQTMEMRRRVVLKVSIRDISTSSSEAYVTSLTSVMASNTIGSNTSKDASDSIKIENKDQNEANRRKPTVTFADQKTSVSSDPGATYAQHNLPKDHLENIRRKQKVSFAIQETRLTILLISILSSYTILTTPNTVLQCYWLWGDTQALWTTNGFNLRYISAPVNVLLTCNYSLNFYLYCFANKDIRETIKNCFK